jgi:predicted nucleic acid-binding protein
MAQKIAVLVDTDVFIDYFNHQLFRGILESERFQVYYSVVTKKELLSKAGLSDSESRAIRKSLAAFRIIPLDGTVLKKYSELRRKHLSSAKEDCLIAASALVKNFTLVTRNDRHFRIFAGLKFFCPS